MEKLLKEYLNLYGNCYYLYQYELKGLVYRCEYRKYEDDEDNTFEDVNITDIIEFIAEKLYENN